MSSKEIKKWDRLSSIYDFFNYGIERRYRNYKKELFSKCHGNVLLVAAGTGTDFELLPENLNITAVDFSPGMLAIAKNRAAQYKGQIKLMVGDVMNLDLPNNYFDTTITSCTFCSVPNPVQGLKELFRTLHKNSKLLMFEHVRPGNFLLGKMADIMTPLSRKIGPNLNRETVKNVQLAGFKIEKEFNIYLNMVKTIEAIKI